MSISCRLPSFLINRRRISASGFPFTTPVGDFSIACAIDRAPRCHEGFLLPARFFALIRLCMWLRGDLNLRAKPLMLLGSIPASKTKTQQSIEIAGFLLSILVAGEANRECDSFLQR
jgi:hypothetical protein